MRDRSALLGGGLTPPASGRSSPFEPPLHAPSGHRYADDLEGQNDEQLEGLSAKVKLLKDVRGLVQQRLCFVVNTHLPKDNDWYWERSPGVECSAQSDGTLVYVRPLSFSAKLLLLERRVCRDVRYPRRDLPPNEQHGRAARLSMVMVHYIPSLRLLVLYHCMVVSTMRTRALTP